MTISHNWSLRRHFFIWAKTDQRRISRRRGGPAWNPLLAHALDTAACVAQLWDRYLPLTAWARLADAFGGGREDTARRVVMLLAALHDLGKGSGCFLRMFGTSQWDGSYLQQARAMWEQQARAAGLPLGEDLDAQPGARHEHITALHLPRLLGCTCEDCGGSGSPSTGLHTAAALLGGHHGDIPSPDTIGRAAMAADITAWLPIYSELIQDTADLIGVDLATLPRLVTPERPSAMVLFAGLVILADWIASDESHFTYRTLTTSPPQWWHTSGMQARAAVTRLRLDAWQPERAADWSDLFPDTPPRPFQTAAMAALPATGPALVIVESDTGSGKTRLALWCAHHLAVTCGYQGLYMALPTRAAANQAAREIAVFMNRALGEQNTANLAVVHATAEATDFVHQLLDAERTRAQAALDGLEDFISTPRPDDPLQRRAVLSPWYLRRCLGLIAPFAVGTVDQVALAAQPSHHWMLRMFGLAAKTLIIDEAHAYELFQQGLLEAAIAWLADAGASVVVLSATLPTAIRTALIRAWCDGHRVPTTPTDQTGPITVVDQHGTITRTGQTDDTDRSSESERTAGSELHTFIDFLPDPGTAALAARLMNEAGKGGITVVIRNRVATAVDLYRAATHCAQTHGWSPREIVLLHGQNLPRYRLPGEGLLTRRLGPGKDRAHHNPERPDRLLVIATQVAEQSLDIDFDRIYTDLAPIDALMQRRGRVHRHQVNDSSRPEAFRKPRMTILTQPGADELPVVEPPNPGEARPQGNPDGHVYPPYLLAATWYALSQRAREDGTVHLITPADTTSLIEEVYGPKPTVVGTLGEILDRTSRRLQSDHGNEEGQSLSRAFRPFTRRGKSISVTDLASGKSHGSGDSDGVAGLRAISRLSEPPIDAILLYKQPNGILSYDPSGQRRADLARHGADSPARRRQQKDLLLNTASLPTHWFTGINALPLPETWPAVPRAALRSRYVALLNPSTGACISGPTGLTCNPVTGLTR
ncbi:CRISPR-associated helicase/endonuclease Cas3 [Streptomyces hyaluromycini]|uniref:CRISPR-associated helicase/endonuclease Cas3 n=1 Tax=Streptomyces hyaluromycini TaxID=1377993 RepID=UPI000B5CEBDE|nr:CRISPR-associated helicase/endonuclease Cas3 [Streptomyces hyaluromycini]